MSKYEPRSKQLKEDAAKKGWKLSWIFRKNRYLYLTITVNSSHRVDWDSSSMHNRVYSWNYPNTYDKMSAWVHAFYPNTKHLTSYSMNKGTWLILDTWEELKNG